MLPLEGHNAETLLKDGDCRMEMTSRPVAGIFSDRPVDYRPDAADEQAKKPAPVVILGAGPAELTAAYELQMRHGWSVHVLEADPHIVGGISRTVTHHGYRFDIGGHRFFSKSQE